MDDPIVRRNQLYELRGKLRTPISNASPGKFNHFMIKAEAAN